LEPAQRSSVLSAFSLSLFAAIQWLTSDMQISSRWIVVVMYGRHQSPTAEIRREKKDIKKKEERRK